jgi:hypothetical protein
MKVRLRPLLSGVAVVAALAGVMFLGSVDSARATTFNPTVSVCVGDLDASGACSTATTPAGAGVPSNFTGALDIPDGDVNFAAVISYIPQQWGVVTGDTVPIGAPVGTLDAHSVLGILSACNQELPVTFDMMNGSLDTKDTVIFNDDDKNNTPDFADDKDNNGLFDAVDKYPDWLNRIFKDQQPIRRSIGITGVAGIPIILQFLIFPPGTLVADDIPNDPGLGFPSVTVLENIGDTSSVPAPSIINDFCTPLSTTNLSLGKTPDGTQLFVNPSDGVYKFNVFALGQRDADADGYENSLDTCALTPNVGNPRITGDGDLDTDGLDAACDPNDNAVTGTNSDQDGDGYLNRQDNCPQVANGEEQTAVAGIGNQKDTDLDTIGDACDPHPTTADTEGTYSVATPASDVTIGAGGSAAGSRPTKTQCPHCWTEGYVVNPDIQPTFAPTSSPTPATSGTTGASSTSTPKVTAPGTSDSGGSSSTVILVVVGVIAAVVVIGGGAALMMRKKKSA